MKGERGRCPGGRPECAALGAGIMRGHKFTQRSDLLKTPPYPLPPPTCCKHTHTRFTHWAPHLVFIGREVRAVQVVACMGQGRGGGAEEGLEGLPS